MIDLSTLAKAPREVATLSRPEREQRVFDLMDEAHAILDYGIETLILNDKRRVAGIVALFSGGNDSTVLTHLFQHRATHGAHANTTVGVEQTRQFVRDTCAAFGLPLIERKPPRISDHYRALVLDRGFPGPAMHFKMFTRLKERGLEEVRRELVKHPWQERVVFLAGRRRSESKRRANVPELGRKGSTVWVSPMVNWTKLDMNTYRLLCGDVPTNQVADILHLSGECLCGAFASQGEREQIEEWFPEALDEIRELEELLKDRVDIPWYRKTWGWGSDPALLKASKLRERKPSKNSGLLCQSCDDKWEQMEKSA